MLKNYPTKPCKYCGKQGHWPYQCFQKPEATKHKLIRNGKVSKQWILTRKTWFRQNPPIILPFPHYECYICGKWLLPPKISGYYSPDIPLEEYPTLDHVLPRSSNPQLRFVQSNLQPCCMDCNTRKGSRKLNGVL